MARTKKTVRVSKEGIPDPFSEVFRARALIIAFMGIITSLLISYLIEEPLIALAHLIRTLEWTYALDVIAFLVFSAIISLIIIMIYLLRRTMREMIEGQIESEKKGFLKGLLSTSFAFLVGDMFIEPIMAFSLWVSTGIFDFDLGRLIDIIIASFLLILFSVSYYLIRYRKIKIVLED